MNISAVIERLSSPLQPKPTKTTALAPPLPNIRAVLFDIYGTLLISGCGDIGVSNESGKAGAFAAALSACNIEWKGDPVLGVAQLHRAILDQQQALRNEGVEHPEVNIVAAWKTMLAGENLSTEALQQLAVEYECRVNPIWPMPGADELLKRLKAASTTIGLISNAQFFTPIACEQLFAGDLTTLGFDPALRFYSYEHSQAKPGSFLYELAANTLAEKGIPPEQTLYVGNDMLNDVFPAQPRGVPHGVVRGRCSQPAVAHR